jgi:hypothetical protein
VRVYTYIFMYVCVSLADAADGVSDAIDAGVCDASADTAACGAATGGADDAPTADDGATADTVADPADEVAATDGNPAEKAGVAAGDVGPR